MYIYFAYYQHFTQAHSSPFLTTGRNKAFRAAKVLTFRLTA